MESSNCSATVLLLQAAPIQEDGPPPIQAGSRALVQLPIQNGGVREQSITPSTQAPTGPQPAPPKENVPQINPPETFRNFYGLPITHKYGKSDGLVRNKAGKVMEDRFGLRYNDGRINPTIYGGRVHYDACVCFYHFLGQGCKYKRQCKLRHVPFLFVEILYMISQGEVQWVERVAAEWKKRYYNKSTKKWPLPNLTRIQPVCQASNPEEMPPTQRRVSLQAGIHGSRFLDVYKHWEEVWVVQSRQKELKWALDNVVAANDPRRGRNWWQVPPSDANQAQQLPANQADKSSAQSKNGSQAEKEVEKEVKAETDKKTVEEKSGEHGVDKLIDLEYDTSGQNIILVDQKDKSTLTLLD